VGVEDAVETMLRRLRSEQEGKPRLEGEVDNINGLGGDGEGEAEEEEDKKEEERLEEKEEG